MLKFRNSLEMSRQSMIPFNIPFYESRFFDRFTSQLKSLDQIQGGGLITKACELKLEYILNTPTLLLDSCTSALELGIRSLNLDPGSEIILPSYTFSSCANACILNNLTPIFVDVEEDTLNQLLSGKYDYIIDAIDNLKIKIAMAKWCMACTATMTRPTLTVKTARRSLVTCSRRLTRMTRLRSSRSSRWCARSSSHPARPASSCS